MQEVKISVKDLEKALDKIKTDTNEENVKLAIKERHICIGCHDRYENYIEIQLFDSDTQLMPKITSTSKL